MKELLEKNNWQFDYHVAEKMARKEMEITFDCMIRDVNLDNPDTNSRYALTVAFRYQYLKNKYWQNYTHTFMYRWVGKYRCKQCGNKAKNLQNSRCHKCDSCNTVSDGKIKQPIKLTEKHCGVEPKKEDFEIKANTKCRGWKYLDKEIPSYYDAVSFDKAIKQYHQAKAECLFDGWDKDVDTGLYYNGVWFLDFRDNKIFVWQSIVSPAIEIQTPHELVTLTKCPLSPEGIKLITG